MKSRAVGIAGTVYWCAVVWDHADITGTASDSNISVTPTTAAQSRARKYPAARLELFPTPTASSTEGVLIYYARQWRDVAEDTDTIFLPDWMEGVYHRAVRAWARGYEEEDTFDKDMALEKLMMGPEGRAAIHQDSVLQVNRGQIRNGQAQPRKIHLPHRFNGSVSGPS